MEETTAQSLESLIQSTLCWYPPPYAQAYYPLAPSCMAALERSSSAEGISAPQEWAFPREAPAICSGLAGDLQNEAWLGGGHMMETHLTGCSKQRFHPTSALGPLAESLLPAPLPATCSPSGHFPALSQNPWVLPLGFLGPMFILGWAQCSQCPAPFQPWSHLGPSQFQAPGFSKLGVARCDSLKA